MEISVLSYPDDFLLFIFTECAQVEVTLWLSYSGMCTCYIYCYKYVIRWPEIIWLFVRCLASAIRPESQWCRHQGE